MSLNVYPVLAGRKWDVTKTAIWNTFAEQAAGGQEFRSGTMTYPLYEFELQYDYLLAADLANLLGFYLQQQGSLTPFYLDSPNDDNIPAGSPVAFGVGDGTTRSWNLLKSTGGLFSEPVGGTPGVFGISGNVGIVYDNGTPVATANYSASDGGLGGTITFTTAPTAGHTLTYSGPYTYIVRFKDDQLTVNQFMNQLWEQKGVTLRTVM